MLAFIRHRPLSLPPILSLVAIALPTLIAVLLAHWLGMQRASETVTRMARQTVARTDMVGNEMKQANRMLAQLAGQDPCSPASIRLMRKAMLQSDTLTDVGYIEGDRLACSALGHRDLPVGVPTYASDAGYTIRNDVRLQDAPRVRLVVASDPETGFSLFAHSTQIMNAIPPNEPWVVAVVGNGRNGAVLAERGKYDPEWSRRVRAGQSGVFVHKRHIVAWERSRQGAYTAFTAMPDAMWQATLHKSLLLGLALGVPASLLLLLVLRRIADRNTTIRYLLRQALKHDELSLAYQPIVELASGRWIGAEALMRWNRPRGETISPDVFIPIAEKSGLMPALGEHLVRMVEREARALFARHPEFHVALNFCAEDLCAEGFPARLQAAIERTGGKPGSLQVEVTERDFLHLEHARPSIDELQKRGIAVAIDDFGTGFSSLSYLTELKFDYLKIDRTFVDTINTGAVTSKIVDHIIAMSKSLGITVIAEGVETRAQADYLREQGVHYAQGWLYAKAMPIRELLDRLAAQEPGSGG